MMMTTQVAVVTTLANTRTRRGRPAKASDERLSEVERIRIDPHTKDRACAFALRYGEPLDKVYRHVLRWMLDHPEQARALLDQRISVGQ